MMGDDGLSREVKSHIFLSNCTSEQKFTIECRILEAYDGGEPLSKDELDKYYILIKSLKDSTYLRCGISPELDETFKTTKSGKNYLKTIRGKYKGVAV